MKNPLNVPAAALRCVAPRSTYDFGFGDPTNGFGLAIRNGRLVEKTNRKAIFYKKHNIVKV